MGEGGGSAAFCRYGDGPPHKFAVWKKSGGQAGGTQEHGAAPTARSWREKGAGGERGGAQASACSGCLSVGVHFSQGLFVFWSGSRAKEVQITDSFIAAELEGGVWEGQGGGLVEGVECR